MAFLDSWRNALFSFLYLDPNLKIVKIYLFTYFLIRTMIFLKIRILWFCHKCFIGILSLQLSNSSFYTIDS